MNETTQAVPAPSREDIKYMKAALKQAEKAIAIGEVPIGAVIVYEGKIIARGYNRRNTDKTTLAHAEITCIRKACRSGRTCSSRWPAAPSPAFTPRRRR